MILLETEHIETYNYIIHRFLKLEIFNECINIGDMIEEFVPKYLYREQYKKCVKTLEDLFYWSNDNFYHQLTAFHEIVLYAFIEYMGDIQDTLDDFNEIYFDKRSRELIKKSAEFDFEECGEFSLKEYEEDYYELHRYSDYLFADTDFLMLDILYNDHQFGSGKIEEMLRTNIDYYFEILPLDIQEKYKTNHITLNGEIHEMLNYIKNRI